MRRFSLISLSVIAGGLTVVQSRLHGAIGAQVRDGLVVAWLSFSVSLAIVLLAVACSRKLRGSVAAIRAGLSRSGDGSRQIRPWHLLGGIGGATFVTAQGATVPTLGVAVFTVAVVAGQNTNSLIVDRLGFGPAGIQPITLLRGAAALAATVGVAIAVSGQVGSPAFNIAAVLFALAAGALVAVQQAVNGRVGDVGGSPWAAGLANFAVGWIAITIALGAERLVVGGSSLWPADWFQPWMLLGGVIGLFFILVAAVAVAGLGVLVFTLAAIAGQVAAALMLAAAFPTPGTQVDAALVLGVLVTGAAVAVASLDKAKRHTWRRDSGDA